MLAPLQPHSDVSVEEKEERYDDYDDYYGDLEYGNVDDYGDLGPCGPT